MFAKEDAHEDWVVGQLEDFVEEGSSELLS